MTNKNDITLPLLQLGRSPQGTVQYILQYNIRGNYLKKFKKQKKTPEFLLDVWDYHWSGTSAIVLE